MHAVELVVADPVRLDDPAELGQKLAGEGLVTVEALGLPDEAQEAFDIPSRESRHGLQRYDE